MNEVASQPTRPGEARGAGRIPDTRDLRAPGVDDLAAAVPGPRKPQAYDLSMAQLDPAVPLEDHRQALAVVQSWFRRAGLSEDESRMLVERFNAAVDPYTRPTAEGDALAEEARDYLRARWGGDYARNMALAEAAIGQLGGPALQRFLEASGLRFDPFVLRTLVDVARRNGWA